MLSGLSIVLTAQFIRPRTPALHPFDGPIDRLRGRGDSELGDRGCARARAARGLAKGAHRGAQGFAHADREHERRFAHRFAAVDDARLAGAGQKIQR